MDFIDKKIYGEQYVSNLNKVVNDAAEVKKAIEEEKEIVRGLVAFSKTSAKQIMRSRIDISAINIDLDFHQVIENINKSGFSRIPVYKGDIDNIEGILYIKDLFPHIKKEKDFEWQKLLRPGYFIPETKKIDELLKDFQVKHLHMAIVVDEYGGTAGLITMEDILEEIVGEISDEFDEDVPEYIRIDDNTWLFESKVSLNDFCKVFDVDSAVFDQVKGENESLGGLLLQLHSGLPKFGDRISYGRFVFTVEAVNNKTVKKVKVSIKQEDEVQQSATE